MLSGAAWEAASTLTSGRRLDGRATDDRSPGAGRAPSWRLAPFVTGQTALFWRDLRHGSCTGTRMRLTATGPPLLGVGWPQHTTQLVIECLQAGTEAASNRPTEASAFPAIRLCRGSLSRPLRKQGPLVPARKDRSTLSPSPSLSKDTPHRHRRRSPVRSLPRNPKPGPLFRQATM
jgi:hypothetical protein